jgi:malate dehydrogenase (quinone)
MPDTTIRSNTEVVLIGAGIMSATLGLILKELQPDMKSSKD